MTWVLSANQFHNLTHYVKKRLKNRPSPHTFISEIHIYKPFEMNDMDSFPNRQPAKAIKLLFGTKMTYVS